MLILIKKKTFFKLKSHKSSKENSQKSKSSANYNETDRKKFKSNQSYVENLNEQERLKVLQALEVESEVKNEH